MKIEDKELMVDDEFKKEYFDTDNETNPQK